ncbi:hypothetical protein [Arenimonas composti]|uniref:Lipoprotein n=1 Tax=Arenimonas composti TR7-09 = DSM 18010 TaxID=1121013 RepID=A0A091BEY0_9GAMM|nr:hypothetical protein [Arenimonas composti]KFN50301.1 hypothetical protein P873_06395 [Arenimonas composti TR7-09 = DSM 18010]
MNTASKLVVATAVIALAGCASSGGTAMVSPTTTSKVDSAYVAAVEHAANKAPVRVRVIWVNPPERQNSAE